MLMTEAEIETAVQLTHEAADKVLAEALGESSSSPSENPALEAAIAALEAFTAEYEAGGDLTSSTSDAWTAAGRPDGPLKEAVEKAEADFHELVMQRRALVDRLLEIVVTDPAESVRKQEVAAKFADAPGCNYDPGFLEDAQLALDSALEDLRAMRDGPPPSGAPGALEGKIAAYHEAETAGEAADDALDAAEAAFQAIYHGPRARVLVDPLLVVQFDDLQAPPPMSFPGGVYTCFTEKEVGMLALPAERVEQMLTALRERKVLVAAADEESGLAAATRAMNEAKDAQSRAWGAAVDRALDVMDHVPGSTDEARRMLRHAQHAFAECALTDGEQVEAYRRLASRTGGLGADARNLWRARWSETYEAACLEAMKDKEASDAYERMEARMPAMPPKGWRYKGGEPVRVLHRSDLTDADTGRFLSCIPKAEADEIRATVNAYWDERDRLVEEEGSDRLTDEADALATTTNRLRRQLYETRAPGVAEIVDKLEEFCGNHMAESCIRFDDAMEVQRALAAGGEAAFFVHLFRDLTALCGLSDPTARVTHFDPAAWVEAFEKHPGHVVTMDGHIAYAVEAFPLPSDEELLITEPEIVAAFYQHIRDNWPDHADENDRRGTTGQPVSLKNNGKALEWAFKDHPEELKHYTAMRARYLAARRTQPVGSPTWRALEPWQQEIVRAYAKRRAANGGPSHNGYACMGEASEWTFPRDESGEVIRTEQGEAKIAAMVST